MANEEHVTLLKQGLNAWNAWRDKNHNIRPNLGGADLIQADLGAADLRGANLSRANLSRANLFGAHLGEADLLAANLSEANLSGATLIHTNFTDLTGCRIFGISAWRLKLDRAKQQNLIITLPNEPEITVEPDVRASHPALWINLSEWQ